MGYTLTQVTPELFLISPISPNNITDRRIKNLYLHKASADGIEF